MPIVINGAATGVNNACVVWNAYKIAKVHGNVTNVNPPINVSDPATWSVWESGSLSVDQFVTYEFDAAHPIDCIGVANHNMFTMSATATISQSNNGTSWTTVTSYTPTSNADFMLIFPQVTAKYVRLAVNVAGVFVSVFVAGKRLVFPHAPIDSYVPLNHARKYTKLRNESLKGSLLGNRVIAAGAYTDVDMGYLNRNWADVNVTPFKTHFDQGGTFFYASCPSKYPLDMGYCWADGEEETVNIEYVEADKLSTVTFRIRSYVAQ